MPDQDKKYAVIVTGDREWHDGAMIHERMKRRYPKGTIVIHGGARGADKLMSTLCQGLNFVEVEVPYLSWLGRAGGQAKNGYMLKILRGLGEVGCELRVEAFHDDLEQSKGTIGMMRLAKRAGVKVKWNHH